MNPALALAIAAALFATPAIYLLTTSVLSQQGSIGSATLTGTAEAVLWAAGAVSLLAPFALPKLLSSFERTNQLVVILAITVSASVFGLVLTYTTGRLAPVRVLGIASMLAILGWAWAYRVCFRAKPLVYVAPRYTTVLVFVGVVSLAFAVLRAALWDRAATSAGGSPSSGFMIFIDTAVAAAALSTARLRKLSSAYARSATQVLSWALLSIPLLGTLTSIYWIVAVRRREQRGVGAHSG